MIVLFDCNSYDKLINLSHKDRQKIMALVEKVILPQAVRNQLDMMIERSDKMEKLSKINQVIAEFDVAEKLEHIGGMFGFVDAYDVENGEIKKDKAIQRKYYSVEGFSNLETFDRKSLGMNSYAKQSYFDSLPDKMRNGDKEIALTAKEEGAMMITDDEAFLNGLRLLDQPVLRFEEFLDVVLGDFLVG